MATSVSALRKQIAQRFPKIWIKDGVDFDSSHGGSLWTGEGSYMPDGAETFNHYDVSDRYVFGVNKEFADFLASKGYFAEAYDAGTYFIWKI